MTRSWTSGAAMLAVIAIAGCAAAPDPTDEPPLAAEAREFMAGYAADLVSHDRDAIAARYSRRGVHLVLPGFRKFEPYDSILRTYREAWDGPESFAWEDLSYEVLGDDAVAVIGAFRWESPPGSGVRANYTAVLVREEGELRIRVENESFDNLPPLECAHQSDPCDLPLDAAALARYTGEYRVAGQEAPGLLYAEDGRLWLQAPGMPAMRLLHEGGHAFRLEDAPAMRVVFDGGGERATSYITFAGLLLGQGHR
jgi:hypothetical protein